MTYVGIIGLILAIVQVVKQIPIPWLKTRTGVQVVNFLVAFVTALASYKAFSVEALINAFQLAVGASGGYELIKTILGRIGISLGGGGPTSNKVTGVRVGGSIGILALIVLTQGACITVPYKGDTELTCQQTADGERECLTCAGEADFPKAGHRKVESTLCLTP